MSKRKIKLVGIALLILLVLSLALVVLLKSEKNTPSILGDSVDSIPEDTSLVISLSATDREVKVDLFRRGKLNSKSWLRELIWVE